jgi:HK97 family phage portal protein
LNYIGELKGTLSKGIGIRDKDVLMSWFGDYWKGLKPSHTGYVAACLNTMGNYFAKATFRLYTKKNGALIEVLDHPFLDLLENPNNFQVENELKHYIGEFFGVYGNFYLLKDRGLASGKIRELQVLDPQKMKPISSPSQWVDHYEYQLGMKTVNFKREDIIHLKYLSSNSHVQGIGLIEAIRDILDIDAFQTAYISQFYENGGFLGQVFTTTQNLRPAEFERAKKELRAEYSGKENSHKLALFTGGLEPIKSAYSLKDMEMTVQRKLTLSEVMTAFRIPQILLGGEGANYTFDTAKSAEYN